MQFEVDMECLILEAEFLWHRFLVTPSQFHSFQELTNHFKLKPHIILAEIPTLSIANDISIIKNALGLTEFAKMELQAINRVRISLQLIFISDLLDSASTKVNQNCKLGIKDPSRTSYYEQLKLIPLADDRAIQKSSQE